MYVLELLPEICSDMSVFHGVRDIDKLDGPTFFRLAWMLDAYGGAVVDAAISVSESAEAEEEEQRQVMSVDELAQWAPGVANPAIGQEVGLFEISKGT